MPQWEAKFAAQARRDVFPDDVRQKPDGFTNTLVTWTGVITNIEYFADPPPRMVRFTAAHHYFDWIEDISIHGYGHDPREPAHVHVDRDDRSAKFWLGSIGLARNFGFRAQELRAIQRIIEDNHEFLVS